MTRSQELFACFLTLLLLNGGATAFAADQPSGRSAPAGKAPVDTVSVPKATHPETETLSQEDRQVVQNLDLLEMLELLKELDDVAALEDAQ